MIALDQPIAAYHADPADAARHVAQMRRDRASGIVGTWRAMEVMASRPVWTVVVAGQPVSVHLDEQQARYELLARLAVGSAD